MNYDFIHLVLRYKLITSQFYIGMEALQNPSDQELIGLNLGKVTFKVGIPHTHQIDHNMPPLWKPLKSLKTIVCIHERWQILVHRSQEYWNPTSSSTFKSGSQFVQKSFAIFLSFWKSQNWSCNFYGQSANKQAHDKVHNPCLFLFSYFCPFTHWISSLYFCHDFSHFFFNLTNNYKWHAFGLNH